MMAREPDICSAAITAASQLDTTGHRRFSGARMRQGLGRTLDRSFPKALILMGDWRVPAGTTAK